MASTPPLRHISTPVSSTFLHVSDDNNVINYLLIKIFYQFVLHNCVDVCVCGRWVLRRLARQLVWLNKSNYVDAHVSRQRSVTDQTGFSLVPMGNLNGSSDQLNMHNTRAYSIAPRRYINLRPNTLTWWNMKLNYLHLLFSITAAYHLMKQFQNRSSATHRHSHSSHCRIYFKGFSHQSHPARSFSV